MNSLIIKAHTDTNIPIQLLNQLWESSENHIRNTMPHIKESDPKFVAEVAKIFWNKIQHSDIQVVKEKYMSKDNFIREGNKWLNALANDNYVAAKEHFPQLVQNSLNQILEKGRVDYLKKMAEELNKK